MKLSPNFTLEEFTRSATAEARGIDNTPPSSVMPSLIATAESMEKVRVQLGNRVILLSSGYRCPLLNKAVGSKPTSQHLLGEAVDASCPSFGTPQDVYEKIRKSSVPYDQLILETDGMVWWVHFSFGPRNRRAALSINTSRTAAG